MKMGLSIPSIKSPYLVMGPASVIHTETGQSSALDLYWGLEEPIWSGGETVRLIDAEGTEQASFVIPGEDNTEDNEAGDQ